MLYENFVQNVNRTVQFNNSYSTVYMYTLQPAFYKKPAATPKLEKKSKEKNKEKNQKLT